MKCLSAGVLDDMEEDRKNAVFNDMFLKRVLHPVGQGLLDAAEIARYMMTLTCDEYEADHPYGENYSEMWRLRRSALREVLERARVIVTELLITGNDIDDDSQRGLMKEIVAECKPFKKSHVCRMDVFLEDAQAKVLSPKRYIAWLQKKVDSVRSSFDK